MDLPSRAALVSMLEPRSVAVVGASAREHTFGWEMMRQLTLGRYAGEVFPVNPRYDEIYGYRCLRSLEEIGEPIDLVLLGVKNESIEGQLAVAARTGAKAAVIFASCFEPPGAAPPLSERLAAVARDAGMAICGGNCMGFVNIAEGVRACGYPEPENLELGPIAFISHSGSAFSALLHNNRGLRFNVVVSAGTELVTTADEYLRYALERLETRVVAVFLETVRRPADFRSVLDLAAERGVAVVALKVGREPRAKELVAAHSGALAGDDAAYEALFEAYGVLRVHTMDEMADTLELFASPRRAAAGGLSAVHDSGGERAHLVDVADDVGVPFAAISAATTARLAAALEEGLPPVNPLDAWGTGNDADAIFAECMRALLEDPETAALAFCVDLTTEGEPGGGYTSVAKAVSSETSKPFAVLSNLSSAIDRRDASSVRRHGIPVLEGTATGLAALRHLFEYRDFHALPPLRVPDPVATDVRERWKTRLGEQAYLSEVDGLRLIADYGVPVVAAEAAGSASEAVEAAERLGWPVVLKTANRAIAHKMDVGGVRLGVATPDDLRTAYFEIAARLGPSVTVEASAPSGIELALGIVRDPQFGPLVVVGAGGFLVEALRDRRVAVPPLDEARARRLLSRLSVARLFSGFRGVHAVDVDAVAGALVRLSALALDLGDDLSALDVNPLIAGPDGCLAVDVLVVPRVKQTIDAVS